MNILCQSVTYVCLHQSVKLKVKGYVLYLNDACYIIVIKIILLIMHRVLFQ